MNGRYLKTNKQSNINKTDPFIGNFTLKNTKNNNTVNFEIDKGLIKIIQTKTKLNFSNFLTQEKIFTPVTEVISKLEKRKDNSSIQKKLNLPNIKKDHLKKKDSNEFLNNFSLKNVSELIPNNLLVDNRNRINSNSLDLYNSYNFSKGERKSMYIERANVHPASDKSIDTRNISLNMLKSSSNNFAIFANMKNQETYSNNINNPLLIKHKKKIGEKYVIQKAYEISLTSYNIKSDNDIMTMKEYKSNENEENTFFLSNGANNQILDLNNLNLKINEKGNLNQIKKLEKTQNKVSLKILTDNKNEKKNRFNSNYTSTQNHFMENNITIASLAEKTIKRKTSQTDDSLEKQSKKKKNKNNFLELRNFYSTQKLSEKEEDFKEWEKHSLEKIDNKILASNKNFDEKRNSNKALIESNINKNAKTEEKIISKIEINENIIENNPIRANKVTEHLEQKESKQFTNLNKNIRLNKINANQKMISNRSYIKFTKNKDNNFKKEVVTQSSLKNFNLKEDLDKKIDTYISKINNEAVPNKIRENLNENEHLNKSESETKSYNKNNLNQVLNQIKEEQEDIILTIQNEILINENRDLNQENLSLTNNSKNINSNEELNKSAKLASFRNAFYKTFLGKAVNKFNSKDGNFNPYDFINDPSYKKLFLVVTYEEEKNTVYLTKALEKNITLRWLDFKNNEITEFFGENISNIINTNKFIYGINFEFNTFCVNASKIIFEALKNSEYIEWADFKENILAEDFYENLADLFKENYCINMMNITHSNLTDQNLFCLFNKIQFNKTLRRLNLSNNSITDKGLFDIKDILKINKKINFLSFAYNNLSDEGMKAIKEFLEENTTITELNLSGNMIGNTGFRYIIEALKLNKTILKLHLEKNLIDNDGCEFLLDFIEDSNEENENGEISLKPEINLSELRLSNNQINNEEMIERLKKHTFVFY